MSPARHQMPATHTPPEIPPVAVSVSAVISASPTVFRGICVAETAGASAVVRVWDSATATSSGKVLLGRYALAAGESREENSMAKVALLGLWYEVVSGTVEGNLTHGR